MTPPAEVRIGLLKEMLRIRCLELRIEELYHLDEMRTPVHLCIGQEAVPVGLCAHLKREDYLTSNHRGHGHYLAKGGEMKRLVAELYGRESGCSGGFGGSMHLSAPEAGLMGSSSIVGGGIPIGVGHALAAKALGQDRISAILFGDGAADEGVLYESVNFAMLKNLPVVFVLENNQYSVCSRVSARQEGEVLFHSLPGERLPSQKIDGNDVIAVYRAAGQAVSRARAGEGPSFIECETYRMRGHAGPGADVNLGYRNAEEISAWEKKDPVARLGTSLQKEGALSDQEAHLLQETVDREVDEAFRFAQASPYPPRGRLGLHLFKE